MLHYVCLTVLCTTARVRFFCGDETRIGLKTITGKKITAKGIKPIGKHQWKFQATYLYGIIEPKTYEHLFWEFSHLNTDCFQIFLERVAQHFSDSIRLVRNINL